MDFYSNHISAFNSINTVTTFRYKKLIKKTIAFTSKGQNCSGTLYNKTSFNQLNGDFTALVKVTIDSIVLYEAFDPIKPFNIRKDISLSGNIVKNTKLQTPFQIKMNTFNYELN